MFLPGLIGKRSVRGRLPGRWVLAACVVLAVVLSGCHHHYMDVVGPLRRMGATEPTRRALPLRVVDSESGERLAGVPVRILSSRHPLELVSDSDGVIHLPLRDDLERENPRMVIDRAGGTSLQWCFTGSVGTANREWRYVTVNGHETVHTRRFSIYYPAGFESEARLVRKELERQYRMIRNVTGLRPVKWAVVVVDKKEQGIDYFVGPGRSAVPTWCYSRAQIREGDFAPTNVHEWTESTIGARLNLARADDRNRFIMDGLSEYLRLTYSGMGDTDIDPLEELKGNGRASVDLLREFRSLSMCGPLGPGWPLRLHKVLKARGFPPGYALSLVFWVDLCREYGPDLPADFLRQMAGKDQRTADVAVGVLEEMTGLQDIEDRLRRADVDAAIRTLRSLSSASVVE